MKVEVDQDLCIGCGVCELMCSQCFQIENGKAQVVRDECGEVSECDIQDVIDSCPTEAIRIVEDNVLKEKGNNNVKDKLLQS